MACLSKLFKAILPFVTMFLVVFAFHFTNLIFFKYYPVVVNLGLFIVFFSSIFQERTVIQKFALAMEPDAKEWVLKYTRNLTYFWSIFMFLNFLVSLITVFLSKEIWILYNGFISYMLVGIFFGIEYIVRCRQRKKNEKFNA